MKAMSSTIEHSHAPPFCVLDALAEEEPYVRMGAAGAMGATVEEDVKRFRPDSAAAASISCSSVIDSKD